MENNTIFIIPDNANKPIKICYEDPLWKFNKDESSKDTIVFSRKMTWEELIHEYDVYFNKDTKEFMIFFKDESED